jgi:GAF domain-containing protein
MRPLRLSRLLAVLLALLAVLAFAMPAPAALLTTAETTASTEEPSVYAGGWEYRWGDSPPGPAGGLSWASTGDDAAWLPFDGTGSPPGRDGQRFLWLRTRLEGSVTREPTLYLRTVDQLVEAYLDGVCVYRFGAFEGPEAFRFAGYKAHYIHLGQAYQGKTLALRIYSEHVNIGIVGQPRIGPRTELTVAVIQRDLPTLGLGLILLSLGAFVLALYASQRKDSGYLAYGAFAVSLGMYFIAAAPTRELFADAPLAWVYAELFSLYVWAIFLAAYFEHVFSLGRRSLVRWFKWTFIVYAAGAAVAMGAGLVPVLRTLFPFQILLLVATLIMTTRAIRESFRGSPDARIFTAGFVTAAVAGSYDILGAMGILSRSNVTVGHLGIFAFTLAMGLILGRRFVEVHDRLSKYSTALQLSLASARVLDPGEQAQVALAELVRLLGAKRAMLFLATAGGTEGCELELCAAREVAGPGLAVSNDITRAVDLVGARIDLVEQVRVRRKPLVARSPEKAHGKRSAMAAPLLLRDELLGVVYLEAEAPRRPFDEADLAILLGLGTQVSITIVNTRAVRLELQSAIQMSRLEKQAALLDAAARMAGGDIETPIAVDTGSEFSDLARALDAMRRDVQAKIHMLEAKNAEVEVLNEELRRKIEERTVNLLSVLLADGTDVAPPRFKRGELIGARYRVVCELGHGSMGVVYEVERTRDYRRLAVKILSGKSDKVAMARFLREAQILAKLDNPYLISIVDIDVTEFGLLYLVMELFTGQTLLRHQSHFGNVRWGLSALRQIAEGLAAVHARGVVHRDLKPSNVLVALGNDGMPRVKLADFGISTLVGDRASFEQPRVDASSVEDDAETLELQRSPSGRMEFTKTGVLLGTPTYMAPELARPSRISHAASDIFALGVIAFEILTCNRAFAAPPIFLVAQGEPLVRPSGLRKVAGLSPKLAVLFESCMAEQPEARPTARHIADTLSGAGIGLPAA